MDIIIRNFPSFTKRNIFLRFLNYLVFVIIFFNFNILAAKEASIEDVLSQEGIFEIESSSNQFSNSDDELRFSGFEHELKDLVGRVERLEHIIAQLKAHLASIEDNLIALSSGKDVKDNLRTSNKNLDKSLPKSVETADFKEDDEERIDYDKALSYLKDGKLQEAELKFDAFIQKYQNSKLLGNAYFWYGETFFRRNLFEKAALYYLKGYKHDSKSSKASDSLLKLALSLGEIHKVQEACVAISKLDKEFPDRSNDSKKRARDAKSKFGCK